MQIQYLDLLCPEWREGLIHLKGVKEIVLKARQFGFSTLILALYFCRTINHSDQNTVIVAHTADDTEMLFQRVRLFWEQLPEELRPRTRYNSRKELYFPDLRSRITVITAGQGSAGRGRTIHNLHASEVGYWPLPKPGRQHILTGLLQAVPRVSGNVFLESTAQGQFGEGQAFHDEYWKADTAFRESVESGEPQEAGAYRSRFFAWYEHEEYEATPARGWQKFQRTREEQRLTLKYHLDERFGLERANRKLYWRRLKRAEPGMEDKFPQEYPCFTPETKISTRRGVIPIMEIQVGDVTESGEVVACYENEPAPIYELTTEQGRILRGTADHPIATPWGFVPLGKLIAGELIQLQVPCFADEPYRVEWSPMPLVDQSIAMTPDLARFLGYFMGDGCWHARTLSVSCDANDADVVDDVRCLIEKMFGVKPATRNICRVKGRKGCDEVRVGLTDAEPYLKALGVLKQYKGRSSWMRNVCVPEAVKRSPQNVVREFLRGLFESDGSITPNGVVRLGLRQDDVLRDVQLLLLGFGINSRVSSAPRKAGNGAFYQEYMLSLNAAASKEFTRKIGFIGERKQAKAVPEGHKPTGRRSFNVLEDVVASVKCDGEEVTYNMTVEDSHVYGANGILTHNCDAKEAFLVSSGTFFFEFDEQRHVIEAPFTPQTGLPHWWRFFGGLDWGVEDPFCFVLCALDERGRQHVIETYQEAGLDDDTMADKCLEVMHRWGVDPKQCLVAYDPQMHSKGRISRSGGVLLGESHIEAFWRAGMMGTVAENRRLWGWSVCRRWLRASVAGDGEADDFVLPEAPGGTEDVDVDETEGFLSTLEIARQRPPRLCIWKGYNAALVADLKGLIFDKVRRNDCDDKAGHTVGLTHASSAWRYANATRPRTAAEKPRAKPTLGSYGPPQRPTPGMQRRRVI